MQTISDVQSVSYDAVLNSSARWSTLVTGVGKMRNCVMREACL